MRTKRSVTTKSPGKKKAKKPKPAQAQRSSGGAPSTVMAWQPGMQQLEEGEELEYDVTAYDCLHRFSLEWPCLSFAVVRDDLGAPRSVFPHTAFLIAGTQASNARHNSLAVVKLANLGQGAHGKQKKDSMQAGEEEEDEDDSIDDSDSEVDDKNPPLFHVRMIAHNGAVNRLKSMPQRPGVVSVWGDTGLVKIYNMDSLLSELAAEQEPKANQAQRKLQVAPLQQHSHSMEGFALDWSPVKAGQLASGDMRGGIHIWEPQEGAAAWRVGAALRGHASSVEDLQWSPTEETVFASCSADRSIRIWDTRERSKAMLVVEAAHAVDVNVLSWNRLVSYMMVSGADDGTLRVWDLRALNAAAGADAAVSMFNFHKGPVTAVEWCPYEGSMLASTSADDQLAVWDLALERDPEEEAALVTPDSAVAPSDLPAQLLFVHAGQHNLKDVHWHAQIPGLLVSTAEDGFNLFKPSNL